MCISLSTPTERQGLSQWVTKQDPTIYRKSLYYKDTDRVKVGREKYILWKHIHIKISIGNHNQPFWLN